MFSHGLLESGGIVGGEEVGFPIEEKVLVLVEEDEIDEAFDVIRWIGIEKFDFWIEVFDLAE